MTLRLAGNDPHPPVSGYPEPRPRGLGRWALVPAVLLLVPIAGTAYAGAVKGKVTGADKLIPQVYADAAKDSHRYSWREPSPTVKKEFRELTANPSRDVCIAAVSSGAAQPHDPVGIVITGGRTTFATIVVSPGTQLQFVNHDPFPHRLYKPGDESFKADEMQPNGRRDWTAPGQGSYQFADKLFPTLRFWVVVDPGAVEMVYPARNGSFAFGNLPPGEYYLKAFFEGKQVGKAVSAVSKGGTVEVKDALNLAEGADSK